MLGAVLMNSLCAGSCIRTFRGVNKILTQSTVSQKRVILLYDFRGSSPRLSRPNGFGFRLRAAHEGSASQSKHVHYEQEAEKRLASYSPL